MISLFGFLLIVWILDSFIFRFTAFVYYIPFFVNVIIGVLIIVFGFWLMSKSSFVFEGTEPRVVDTGVYARVRHPMYLGMVLVHVGIWFISLSLVTLIPLLMVFFGYNFLASDEERRMEAKFGTEYQEYKKRVGKWIPH